MTIQNAYQRSFQERHSFEDRRVSFKHVQAIHPDKVPVIIERYAGETTLPELIECRFVVSEETTLHQLVWMVRTRLQLTPAQSFLFFVNNAALVSSSTSMRRLQSRHCHEDGFLYLTYASQTSFG